MSSFESRYDQIEAYLKGNLSKAEQVNFENEIEKDQALAEEVGIQREAFKLVERAYYLEMSSIIREQTKAKPSGVIKWLLGGGFITLLMGAFLLIPKSSEIPSPVVDSSVNEATIADTMSIVHSQVNQLEFTQEKQVEELISEPEMKRVQKEEIVQKSKATEASEVNDATEPKPEGRNKKNAKEFQGNKEIEGTQRNSLEDQAKNDCSKVPQVEVQVSHSHLDLNDGSIRITSKDGLMYRVNDDKFQSSGEFTELQSGTYQISVRSDDQCLFDIGWKEVKRSSCSDQRDLSFNATFQRTVVLPVDEYYSSNIQIFNKLGQIELELELTVGETFEWDGKNNRGEEVTMGAHKVFVNYDSGEACLYNVVVEK